MANRLKKYREAQGLSCEELARKVNVTETTLVSIEVGSYTPSLQLALKLARECGVAVEALFDIEPEETAQAPTRAWPWWQGVLIVGLAVAAVWFLSGLDLLNRYGSVVWEASKILDWALPVLMAIIALVSLVLGAAYYRAGCRLYKQGDGSWKARKTACEKLNDCYVTAANARAISWVVGCMWLQHLWLFGWRISGTFFEALLWISWFAVLLTQRALKAKANKLEDRIMPCQPGTMDERQIAYQAQAMQRGGTVAVKACRILLWSFLAMGMVFQMGFWPCIAMVVVMGIFIVSVNREALRLSRKR